MDTIDWTRPLTFNVRGDAYPCADGSWNQLSIGLLNHGARGRTPAYLWVIQGHGGTSNDMGRQLEGLWPIRCLLIFALISRD